MYSFKIVHGGYYIISMKFFFLFFLAIIFILKCYKLIEIVRNYKNRLSTYTQYKLDSELKT